MGTSQRLVVFGYGVWRVGTSQRLVVFGKDAANNYQPKVEHCNHVREELF